MNQEKNKNKKEIIVMTLSVVILIVAVIGISYSIWTQTFMGTKENSINTGYISFSYTESNTNVIEIKDAVPISDENGKKLTGNTNMFDFTVSAKYAGVPSIDYEIYITPSKQTLESKYVKVYLTNQNDQPLPGFENEVPTYESLMDSNIDDSKVVYKSSLKNSNSSADYRLRIWVSSEYNEPSLSKDFSFKVNVIGVA